MVRDRLIARAAREPGWVLGFQDETWWTRLAQPDLFAWAGADPLRLGANARDPKGGSPEAVACYGVLRLDTGGMMLRFCEGRPVSATTEGFLGWVCEQLAAEGKTVFVLVWDNAAWHVSQRVGRWVARHNRRVRAHGGCRIRVCPLPIKAPWLNPIEPSGSTASGPSSSRTASSPRRNCGSGWTTTSAVHICHRYQSLSLEPALGAITRVIGHATSGPLT
jgi:hypothetical protein